MKNKNILWYIVWAIIGFIAFCWVMSWFGCTSQKHITTERIIVDSTAIIEKMDSIRVLKEENNTLTIQLHELQYAGVEFDKDGQHPMFIIDSTADCNVDSLIALLNNYKNKVKIYADGTIEAEGKLKSAYYSKDKLSKFISELQRINDSLKLVKNKVITEVKTDTVIKEKKVKRSFLNFWWLLLIGIAGGYYLRGRLGKIFGII